LAQTKPSEFGFKETTYDTRGKTVAEENVEASSKFAKSN